MKKILSILLLMSMVLTLSVTAFAVETNNHNLQLTDEILLSMTGEDHVECYDYLVEYKRANPNCSNEELDTVASNFYIEVYRNKAVKPSPNGFYDDLLMDATGLNPDELVLAKKYPSDLAAVYSSAQIANKQAASRYNQGAYLGNQDAFRHAAWNALLICRFYALQKGDYDWCFARTREWTTAHETGADVDRNMSAAQRKADYDMDITNNMAGRAAAETTYTNETLALQKVQQFVDTGLCRRVKTDAQMTYSYDQMLAIPNWSLRTTNTVGKK